MKLDLPEELRFQLWIRKTPWYSEFVRNYGEEPDLDTPQYDYRAAYKAGIEPQKNKHDGLYHWPSSLPDGTMLKSEDHPTMWKELFMRKYGVDPDALPH